MQLNLRGRFFVSVELWRRPDRQIFLPAGSRSLDLILKDLFASAAQGDFTEKLT
jgi:hypothetical protein